MAKGDYPYELIEVSTGKIVCRYKAQSIAIRDCKTKNDDHNDGNNVLNFYVKRIKDGKMFA